MKRMLIGLLGLALAGCVHTLENPELKTVETEPGSMKPYWPKGEHVQGFACSPDAIYLGHQHGLFKYDWNGKFLKHVSAPCHTGDICWYEGKVYTSVDILEGSRPKRSGVVQVYDEDLNLLAERDIPQGIDGITAKDGVLYLGMNATPKNHRINQIGRMDAKTLTFLDRIDIDYGTDTSWGTQDIATDGENFWVAFYSKVPLAVFDSDWKPVRTLNFGANTGLEHLPTARQGVRPRFARGINVKNGDDPAYRIEFFEFDGTKMVPVKIP